MKPSKQKHHCAPKVISIVSNWGSFYGKGNVHYAWNRRKSRSGSLQGSIEGFGAIPVVKTKELVGDRQRIYLLASLEQGRHE